VELLALSALPIVVVLVLLYLVIKRAASSAPRNIASAFRERPIKSSHTARESLNERYASGEIWCEEYEQMSRDVHAERTAPRTFPADEVTVKALLNWPVMW
jgi:uncharacterized membrane protein